MDQTVSVVVPCHNAAPFLRETLDSLVNQTCKPREVIVVDDGSTDESAEIARSYGTPVRVICQENQGAGAARMAGASVAKGDLITFNDADDPAPKRKIEALMEALVHHPECVAAIGVTWISQRVCPTLTEWYKGDLDGRTTLITDPLARLLGSSWPLVDGMNLITYRELAVECCQERPFYRAGNDYDFQIRLAQRGQFVHVAELTSRASQHPKGISATYGLPRQMAYALCAAAEVFANLPSQEGFRRPWRERVEMDWPRIAVGLIALHEWPLLCRVLRTASPYVQWHCAPRRFWWALDTAFEGGSRLSLPLQMMGRLGRMARAAERMLKGS
jgi:glycosyltransferase involved in cell wall biosynthesis